MRRSSNAAGLGALWVAGWLTMIPGVRANPPEIIDVPAACGSEMTFRRALARLTGEGANVPAYRVAIAGADTRGRYRLRVEQAGSTRELLDRDCRALFRSAVVIVATAALEPSVDSEPEQPSAGAAAWDRGRLETSTDVATSSPELARMQPAEASLASAPASARPSPSIAAPPAPGSRAIASVARRSSPSRPAPSRPGSGAEPRQPAPGDAEAPEPVESSSDSVPSLWSASLGLGAGALLGLTPQAAPTMELVASAERLGWGVAVGVNYVFSTTADAELGRGADIDALGMWLAGSFRPWSPLNLRAGVALARLEGAGRGSLESFTDSAWSLGPRLELALTTLSAGAMQVEVGAAAQWALLRPSFEITGFGPVYRTADLSGAAIARLSWAFR